MKKTKKKYFPFFFNISRKRVLVVGAGEVAFRRIKSLLDFDVQIIVFAFKVDERILTLQTEDSDLQIHIGILEADIDGERGKACRNRFLDCLHEADIVLAATSDSKLNSAIIHIAKELGKWGNNASDHTECDFFFPALAGTDEITIGIAGNGIDHKQVKNVARKIRDLLNER